MLLHFSSDQPTRSENNMSTLPLFRICRAMCARFYHHWNTSICLSHTRARAHTFHAEIGLQLVDGICDGGCEMNRISVSRVSFFQPANAPKIMQHACKTGRFSLNMSSRLYFKGNVGGKNDAACHFRSVFCGPWAKGNALWSQCSRFEGETCW